MFDPTFDALNLSDALESREQTERAPCDACLYFSCVDRECGLTPEPREHGEEVSQ